MHIHSGGASPQVHPTALVAPTAVLSGDVRVGPHCSIGHGAVLVAEGAPVTLGARCVVMETAVLRGVPGFALRLGNHVLVGPRAHLSGCAVDDEVFIATGAAVFNGAVLGRRCEVRINGTVHLRTVLPEGATVPIGWVAVGDPARILPPHEHDAIWAVQRPLDFPGTVFGLDRQAEGERLMQTLTTRYTDALARRHADDRPIDAPAQAAAR